LFYFFSKILFCQGNSGPLIKNSLILAAQNYKIKSVCKYNSKFVPFMQNGFYSCYRKFCDDTAAAVLHNDKVLSNVVANQEIHTQYGGVVPELASRTPTKYSSCYRCCTSKQTLTKNNYLQ
jgi:hypothetical protein